MKFTWKQFPENPLSHAPKLQNLEKVWKKFPGYPLSHLPFFGNSFRDSPLWVNYAGDGTSMIFYFRSIPTPTLLEYLLRWIKIQSETNKKWIRSGFLHVISYSKKLVRNLLELNFLMVNSLASCKVGFGQAAVVALQRISIFIRSFILNLSLK